MAPTPPCWNPAIGPWWSAAPHPALQVLLEQSPSYYRTLTHKLHWAGSLTAIEPSHN